MPELVAGKLTQLSPSLYRVLAPNPSVMTGPGTNTYIVVGDTLAIVDPGPALPAHLDAIREGAKQLAKPVSHVVVTHTHHDHSPGASVLAAEWKVPLAGMEPPDDHFQDKTCHPDTLLHDADEIELGHGVKMVAVYTPGHVVNHLCFWIPTDGAMLTGDHLMSGSTVVIIPPEGSMADYMNSLRKLQRFDMAFLAPGHGDIIEQTVQYVEGIIQHRGRREQKVIDALQKLHSATIPQLVTLAYDDTPTNLHKWAELSLHAHLIKLQQEHRVSQKQEHWTLSDTP